MSSKQKKKTRTPPPIKSPVQQENGRKNVWKGFSLFFPAVVVMVGIITYSNTFDCSFHFDDYNIIESNVVKESAGIKDWINLFPGRPFGTLTFALNYHFHKLHVWGYHFINLTIHLANALLVWWLTLLTLSTPKMKDESISRQKATVAFIVALLFVSHPLATQSVTYIVQRFTSLATMFYLLSLALYVKGRLWQRERKVSRFFYGASIVCALLGMLTKEIVFTLPFAILLYEFCFLKTDAWKIDLKDKSIQVFLMIFGTFVVFFFMNYSFKVFDTVPPLPLQGYDYPITAREYLFTQFSVIVTYLRLFILPVNQNLDYDYPLSRGLSEVHTLMNLCLLLSIMAAGIIIFRRYRLVSFGIFWFFLTLSVESSILPISQNVIFEHRTYLPSFGFFIALTGTFFYILRDKYMKIATGVLLTLVCVNAVLTHERNKVWKDEYTLWSDCIKKSPNKPRVLLNFGKTLADMGHPSEAIRYYDKAIEIFPWYDSAYYNRGNARVALKDYNGALADYEAAIKANPFYSDSHNNLGNVKLTHFRDYAGAIDHYDMAIKMNPDNDQAYANMGVSRFMLNDLKGACSDWRTAAGMGNGPAGDLLQKFCK